MENMNRRKFLKVSSAVAATPVVSSCGGPNKEIIQDLPVSSFSGSTTAEEVTEGIDLSGKVAVVTGCNSGIGFETMRVLAMRGAHVLGTGRTMEKAKAACNSVVGKATPIGLELTDLQSCVDCAVTIRDKVDKIDIFIANAGIMSGDRLEVVNGMEKTLAVNHLGHFVLINRIIEQVKNAAQGRVIMVGSGASYGSLPDGGINFDNIDGAQGYSSFEFYSQSKLANSLFALELAERLRGTNVTANSLTPGFVKTSIGRNIDGVMKFAMDIAGNVFAKTTEEGAAIICYLASSPELNRVSGYYFEDFNPMKIEDSYHYDKKLAKKLWQVSEDLTQDYLVPI
jgi:NAD(P)-dependent dehydrogenase (short-subunit alcohol dehydrogenase family)